MRCINQPPIQHTPAPLALAQLKVECKPWKIELPTRKLELEFTTISSSYHVELNPSDVGNNDRCAGAGPRGAARGLCAGAHSWLSGWRFL